MTNLYRFIFPVLDALLRSSKDLHHILGIVLGVFLGMFPFGTLQWYVSLLAFLVLRVNLLSFLISGTASYLFAYSCDPLWNSMGFRLLTTRPDLFSLWGRMHHAPLVPFTEFNNTVALGLSLAACVVAFSGAALFFVFRRHIKGAVSMLWYTTKMSRFYAHYRRH